MERCVGLVVIDTLRHGRVIVNVPLRVKFKCEYSETGTHSDMLRRWLSQAPQLSASYLWMRRSLTDLCLALTTLGN